MDNKKYDLTGKVALITGAAGLLGVEHCEALLECNADLVLLDINMEMLLNVKNYLSDKYRKNKIYTFTVDLTQKKSLEEVRDYLLKKNISINILINNAAVNPKVEKGLGLLNSSRLEFFPLDEWNKQISVGLTGAFLCSQIFGSEMAKSGTSSCIVNIASDLSIISPDQRIYRDTSFCENEQPVKPVTYSVIKAGLVGLTKYLATYWLGSNIRCNALSPGGVFTNQSDEFVTKLSSLIPLGRMARKDEYRAAIQFLCSEASSYMNGHNLIMDGGRSIW